MPLSLIETNYSQTSGDDRMTFLTAGLCSLCAGVCWIGWIILNSWCGRSIEASAMYLADRVLLVGANVLLLPGALSLYQSAAKVDRSGALISTICGCIGLSFWAYGAATHSITPALEVTYLTLSAIWWLGISARLSPLSRPFAVFTTILGAFALLDAGLTAFEPMPAWIYALASPKLPLGIAWDFALTFVLLRQNRIAPQKRCICRAPSPTHRTKMTQAVHALSRRKCSLRRH